MHAYGVHIGVARYVQYAMQQTAPFGTCDGHIEIARSLDRVFGQQGITVMAVWVHGVAAVGEVAPHAVGEKLVLRGCWPVFVARCVFVMLTQHFLQEHQVGTGTAHCLAQLGEDKATVEDGKSLVRIDRQDLELMDSSSCCRSGR